MSEACINSCTKISYAFAIAVIVHVNATYQIDIIIHFFPMRIVMSIIF